MVIFLWFNLKQTVVFFLKRVSPPSPFSLFSFCQEQSRTEAKQLQEVKEVASRLQKRKWTPDVPTSETVSLSTFNVHSRATHQQVFCRTRLILRMEEKQNIWLQMQGCFSYYSLATLINQLDDGFILLVARGNDSAKLWTHGKYIAPARKQANKNKNSSPSVMKPFNYFMFFFKRGEKKTLNFVTSCEKIFNCGHRSYSIQKECKI